MAKFRDATDDTTVLPAGTSAALSHDDAAAAPVEPDPAVHDRSIGDILAELRHLSADQVAKVLAHQREKGVRFGEAAVALGLASKDDVIFALAQQFHYPYAPEEQRKLQGDLVALNEPFSARAESFRALRSQLMMRLFSDADGMGGPGRALAVIKIGRAHV